MGRNARMKAMRKTLRKLGINNPRPKTIANMIECPFCHAWSYPRGINNPKNDEEKNAIICGSCHKDLTPIIEERKRAAAEKEELKTGITPLDVKAAPLELVSKEDTDENT